MKYINYIKKTAEGNQVNYPLLIYINYFKLCLFVIMFCVMSKGYSQKEYNNWYLGIHAGLTFQSGIPVPLLNSAMYTGEGCATISDKQGNLLFYTDGCTVYNKSHGIMTNGTGLLGSFTSTQSALIIQKPRCKTIYYIFTVYYEGHGGLNYSIVDIEKDGGLGEIILKNVTLYDTVAEKLTAIRHANGNDIWIITHQFKSNAYLSFLLNPMGITNKFVKSNVGLVLVNQNLENSAGYLKPSPNGKFLCDALCGLGYFRLMRFDRNNGKLFDPILVLDSVPIHPQNYSGIYGVEFSTNSNFLYTSSENHKRIYQYSVTNYDSIAIVQSKCLIGTTDNWGAMQLGPNGKIYIAQSTTSFLAVIRDPNLKGIQCNYQDKSFSLSGRITGGGLPNNPFTGPYIQYDGCYTGSYNFHLTDTSSFINWNFGDYGHPNNTAIGNDPNHDYIQAGVYTVTAIYLTDWNTYDTASITVSVNSKPSLFQSKIIKVCGNNPVTITADSVFDHYNWNTGSTSKQIVVTDPGIYVVTASDCSCTLIDSVEVLSPHIKGPADTTVCPGDKLSLTAAYPGATYLWNTGITQASINIQEPGLYWVKINADTCNVIDSCLVNFSLLNLDIGKDTVKCSGSSFYLEANGIYDSVKWWDGQTFPSHVITEPGIYSATAYLSGCSLTKEIQVRLCTEIHFPNVFTPNGDQFNDFFLPESKGVEQYNLQIYNRYGVKLFETSDPNVGWDGTFKGNICSDGTYYYIATFQSWSSFGNNNERLMGVAMLIR